MIDETLINNAKSLADLEDLIAKCERCLLYKTKTKDVPGIGNEHAEVMFIGEAPGKDEDLQGEPFVGAAGKFLTEMIEDLGWKRSDVYIANVLKHRPPNNRDPEPSEADACWPYLKRQIEIISPKLIVFLGRHSMARFFPTLQISKVHGQAFRKEFLGKSQVFLALYHPAAALYNGGMRDTLKNDFQKIPKILDKIDEITASKPSEKATTPTNTEQIKQEKLF
ncbi:MAG: uracil-DNA glycosylase [Patescibacteria group bacterium]|nr:uracil-DNA glycosylase [Patescibacteria group bacterium]